MRWSHSVNREWLTERKKYVTASDILRLLPVTASGRPRANMDEAYRKVWAEKQCDVTDEDVMSSGAAARGHVLEKYAVKAYNELMGEPWVLHHWDDMLVYSKDGVSCSPDALDVRQLSNSCVTTQGSTLGPEVVGEIKCYAPASHYEVGLGDRMLLDERWQIATAFYTMPSLVRGVLILFNPAAKHPLFVHGYERDDLLAELDTIRDVNEKYWAEAKLIEGAAAALCDPVIRADCISEEEIVAELLKEEEIRAGSLNP